jgi:hypothetical protein
VAPSSGTQQWHPEVARVLKSHQSKKPIMSNLEQIELIKANTLAQMAAVSAERKPSYTEDGQSFEWTAYLEHLQRRVEWCNAQLVAEAPFEIPTQGYTP